jgi:argininosuccinate lyase
MTRTGHPSNGKNDERAAKNFAASVNSFDFDRRLFAYAARVNLVYCDALFHAGVFTRIESERVKNGLQTILKRADFYADYFHEPGAADVHSFIEMRLAQLVGEAGAKLNVGRNRYEQTATAFRLWLRKEIEEISKEARDLQTALLGAGERQRAALLPTYVKSQKSQPILWAHWCLAYFEMFSRDRERLEEVWRRVNILPLGAAAGAGTGFEIDREEIARALGFEGVTANSLDAVADADFAVESVAACSLLMLHLSRLAEDLIAYNSAEFSFISFNESAKDNLTSPSTKKDFEILELIRAKAGRVFGHQAALFSTMKSLPLGVHTDAQENVKAVFDSVDTVKLCLQVCSLIVGNLHVDETKTLAAVNDYLNAAELADYLAQKNFSWRIAENLADEIASYAAAQKKRLPELSLEEFSKFSDNIGADVYHALSLEQTLASKNQIGGTAPERVFEALEQARESLERE